MITSGRPDAKTYSQLQREELELEQRVMRRKPGAEVPTLPSVPFNPSGIWNHVDRGESDG